MTALTDQDAKHICGALDDISGDFGAFLEQFAEECGASSVEANETTYALWQTRRIAEALTAVAFLFARRDGEVWAEWGSWSNHSHYGPTDTTDTVGPYGR